MSWIAQRPPLFSRFFHIFYGLCSCWTLSYISRSEQPRGIHVPSTWLRPLSYLISFFVSPSPKAASPSGHLTTWSVHGRLFRRLVYIGLWLHS